ncbi:hypothetical protein M8J77_012579 [Diaphorina citri]|nr:hypothetical protein M8J77_012579 [Diaphorina citri]
MSLIFIRSSKASHSLSGRPDQVYLSGLPDNDIQIANATPRLYDSAKRVSGLKFHGDYLHKLSTLMKHRINDQYQRYYQ